MSVLSTIESRSSTRVFKKGCEIDNDILEKILYYASKAPSAHNLQPWHYVVVRKQRKEELLRVLSNSKKEIFEDLRENVPRLAAVFNRTLRLLDSCSVVIFVYNTGRNYYESHLGGPLNEKYFYSKPDEYVKVLEHTDWVNSIISIGLSIQNMLLASTELGVGSICLSNSLIWGRFINEFLNTDKELVSVVALGYNDLESFSVPKKSVNEVSSIYE